MTSWKKSMLTCALVLAACGDEETGDISPSGSDGGATKGWCAAREVIQDACVVCHAKQPVGGAPMSLASLEDFRADAKLSVGKKVSDVVKARIHDSAKPMPPSRVLSASELAAIDDWIASGMKEDPSCPKTVEAETPSAPWPPPGCDEVYEVRAGENGQKTVIKAGAEIHPQFYLDAPWGEEKVQAVGFRALTDNSKILHHWIIYENTGVGGAYITGWAPGKDESKLQLPSDIGVNLPTGPKSLRLDMHYFNLTGTQDELDASGVEICVTRTPRPIVATTFQGFAALPLIAPGAEVDISGTCTVELTQPVFLMSSHPHAHTRATWAKLAVQRGDQTIVLHDKAFQFEEQSVTPFEPFFELKQGDVVTTTCHYKNDSTKLITFSESTTGEMCFNFAAYYPMGALKCAGGLFNR